MLRPWLSTNRRLLEKEENALSSDPSDQQERAGCHGQHQERAEILVLRRASQWSALFHGFHDILRPETLKLTAEQRRVGRLTNIRNTSKTLLDLLGRFRHSIRGK
jgi:hypothetical protein